MTSYLFILSETIVILKAQKSFQRNGFSSRFLPLVGLPSEINVENLLLRFAKIITFHYRQSIKLH